jgi:hypothetical protein
MDVMYMWYKCDVNVISMSYEWHMNVIQMTYSQLGFSRRSASKHPWANSFVILGNAIQNHRTHIGTFGHVQRTETKHRTNYLNKPWTPEPPGRISLKNHPGNYQGFPWELSGFTWELSGNSLRTLECPWMILKNP